MGVDGRVLQKAISHPKKKKKNLKVKGVSLNCVFLFGYALKQMWLSSSFSIDVERKGKKKICDESLIPIDKSEWKKMSFLK